jgi:predicted  nucleic acid-binding Zn-ribbon protein
VTLIEQYPYLKEELSEILDVVLNTEETLTALKNEHEELEARHNELQHEYDNTVADNDELRTPGS